MSVVEDDGEEIPFDDEDERVVEGVGIEGSTIESAIEIVRKRLDKTMKSPDVEGAIEIQLLQKVKMGELSVDRFRLGFGEDTKEKAQEIVQAAVDHALKDPATNLSFRVRVLGFPQATIFDIRRIGGTDGGFSAESPFMPNQAGFNEATVSLLSHLMKFNDGLAKQLGVAGRREADLLYSLLKDANDKVNILESRHFDVIRQAEELISMGWARRREEKKAEQAERREEEMIAMAKAIGPGLAAHLKLLPPHVAQMMQQAIAASDAAANAPPPTAASDQQSAVGQSGGERQWIEDLRAVQAGLMAMPAEFVQGLFANLSPEAQAALQRMILRADKAGPK